MPLIGQCPYIISTKGTMNLVCEAGRIGFLSPVMRQNLLTCYCCNDDHYKDCSLYKALEAHYDAKYSDSSCDATIEDVTLAPKPTVNSPAGGTDLDSIVKYIQECGVRMTTQQRRRVLKQCTYCGERDADTLAGKAYCNSCSHKLYLRYKKR